MDQDFEKLYHAESQTRTIVGLLASLAIFIACLGLFGLAAFIAEQRTKEIGIRKVLGANVAGIIALMSKDFLKLIVVAFVIAVPIAWYAGSNGLRASLIAPRSRGRYLLLRDYRRRQLRCSP